MSSNLSSKQLWYLSMMTSLVFGLKEDLGLNLSTAKDCTLFMKCYIGRIFLSYSSNSLCNFARSILLAVRRNFKPLDSIEISEAERFPLETVITILLTHLPSNLTPISEAMLFPCKTLHFFKIVESVLLNFSFFLSYAFDTLRKPDSSWQVWEALFIFSWVL